MNRLTVSVSEAVKQQITEQVFFIAQDSIDHALLWEARLRAAINGLGEFYGHAVDEVASQRVGQIIHKMVFEKTYLVHYQVNVAAGVVEVVNFRHGSRLPQRGEP
jgi:plasmid stabilization system protein ParE